jgi:hypothetical protein
MAKLRVLDAENDFIPQDCARFTINDHKGKRGAVFSR